jgi:methylated-DNA-protein-cysteine methyltransferase-like protein
MKSPETFSSKAKAIIKRVPKGKVATYGQIAAMAGSPLGARQVVRVLHSSSRSDNLPWHRIINKAGKIALQPGQGFEEQKSLLLQEGVLFSRDGTVDLNRYQWNPLTKTG